MIEAMNDKQVQEKPIQFRPLDRGLGFHPFEQGLPYTPPAAPSKSIPLSERPGAGAQAAGTPTFVFPKNPAPLRGDLVHSTAPATTPATVKLLEFDRSGRIFEAPPRETLGYVLKRVVASLVDFSVLGLLVGTLFLALLTREDFFGAILQDLGLFLGALLFSFLCVWTLLTAQEVAFKTSLGKWLMGLQLEGTQGEIFLRSLLFVPSVLLLGIGLLFALFDPMKRCWHDQVMEISPVRRDR
jgi:uncharacterized RDD family membrane protein YckC